MTFSDGGNIPGDHFLEVATQHWNRRLLARAEVGAAATLMSGARDVACTQAALADVVVLG
ncbi:hypothetical protein [Mycobacteroides abscessus]|uniref:hypothetical protein n=1 Tax=Mycobacteroides abscessus TaxID=36809 RepID=UPI0012FEC946|nr:hypothetical protein [Mycobacteroides abscessus]